MEITNCILSTRNSRWPNTESAINLVTVLPNILAQEAATGLPVRIINVVDATKDGDYPKSLCNSIAIATLAFPGKPYAAAIVTMAFEVHRNYPENHWKKFGIPQPDPQFDIDTTKKKNYTIYTSAYKRFDFEENQLDNLETITKEYISLKEMRVRQSKREIPVGPCSSGVSSYLEIGIEVSYETLLRHRLTEISKRLRKHARLGWPNGESLTNLVSLSANFFFSAAANAPMRAVNLLQGIQRENRSKTLCSIVGLAALALPYGAYGAACADVACEAYNAYSNYRHKIEKPDPTEAYQLLGISDDKKYTLDHAEQCYNEAKEKQREKSRIEIPKGGEPKARALQMQEDIEVAYETVLKEHHKEVNKRLTEHIGPQKREETKKRYKSLEVSPAERMKRLKEKKARNREIGRRQRAEEVLDPIPKRFTSQLDDID